MTTTASPVPGFHLDTPPPPPSKPARVTKRDDTVVLRGVPVSLSSDVGCALITDLSRNKERLFSDEQVCQKYDITPSNWTSITQSKAIRLLVNAEHERRMLRGVAAQEAAAKEFTAAPQVLGKILQDERQSAKHRIDASRELRATAQPGAEKPTDTADRFVITINLGADVKPIVVDAGPIPPKQTEWKEHDAEQ